MDTRVLRRCGVLLLAAALAGCAALAERPEAGAPDPSERAAARQLYEGEPAVMHATEYPVTSAAEGIARGDEAWRKGDLDLAVYLYVQSLAYDAKNPAPLQKIGAIHEKRGNHALAERAFEMALRLDPDNAATNERLGLLYLQSQRHEAAEALFARAVEKDVKRWQSHNGLGILADRRGEYAAAIAHYDDALAVEPLATTVINNRGYSRYLAGDFAGAEAEYRHALSLGAWGGAWINLGMVQARQRRYEEALDSFLKVHDEAHAHNLLGEVAMEGGDLDTAQNEFMLALSASPRFFEKAQENLEQVAERITEREQREAASGVGGATPESASALPGGTAAAVAVFVPQSTVAYAGKSGYGKKQRQQEGREVSCSGAAALKPRCNPYSVKPNKPYRVAAYKPPKY